MNQSKNEKMLAAYLLDELDTKTRNELSAALEADGILREKLADMRLALKILNQGLEEEEQPRLSDDRLEVLMGAVTKVEKVPVKLSPRHTRMTRAPWRKILVMSGSLAATLLLAFGLWIMASPSAQHDGYMLVRDESPGTPDNAEVYDKDYAANAKKPEGTMAFGFPVPLHGDFEAVTRGKEKDGFSIGDSPSVGWMYGENGDGKDATGLEGKRDGRNLKLFRYSWDRIAAPDVDEDERYAYNGEIKNGYFDETTKSKFVGYKKPTYGLVTVVGAVTRPSDRAKVLTDVDEVTLKKAIELLGTAQAELDKGVKRRVNEPADTSDLPEVLPVSKSPSTPDNPREGENKKKPIRAGEDRKDLSGTSQPGSGKPAERSKVDGLEKDEAKKAPESVYLEDNLDFVLDGERKAKQDQAAAEQFKDIGKKLHKAVLPATPAKPAGQKPHDPWTGAAVPVV
ncbi:MAG TPA: hypothetical protein ENL03_05870, partial [Phycisphaerae bacterium]|nr:hypothetical protein [Phycisphaerae bacterium]